MLLTPNNCCSLNQIPLCSWKKKLQLFCWHWILVSKYNFLCIKKRLGSFQAWSLGLPFLCPPAKWKPLLCPTSITQCQHGKGIVGAVRPEDLGLNFGKWFKLSEAELLYLKTGLMGMFLSLLAVLQFEPGPHACWVGTLPVEPLHQLLGMFLKEIKVRASLGPVVTSLGV
jgi:hypothetical protein